MMREFRLGAFFLLASIFLLFSNFGSVVVWAANSSEQEKLEKYLTVESALLGVNDNVSWYFKDLKQPLEVGLNATRSWIPASTIKVFVMLEAFRQRRLGMVDFSQTVTIKALNVVPTAMETDGYPTLIEGTQVSVKQLVEMMIVQSDNTAYNTLLDLLDRRNVNLTLAALGMTQTTVGEKLSLDDIQLQQDLTVPGRQNNTVTAKDFLTVFDLLYHRKMPDADEMLEILKRQKLNDMIPSLLPEGTVVAHKTGAWAPIYHDGGIVYKPGDPFVLAIFTSDNDPSVVAKLSKVAYFRNADSVISSLSSGKPVTRGFPRRRAERIYLASEPQSERNRGILGETAGKFPEITAADLGITRADLVMDFTDAEKVASARVLPGSFLYPFKRFLEKLQLTLAITPDLAIGVLADQSQARLAEAKALLLLRKTGAAEEVVGESQRDLRLATSLVGSVKDKDAKLSRIGQVNSVHFAAFSQSASAFNDSTTLEKEKFVDMVYGFYQKQKKEVIPRVAASQVASPLLRAPILGTVTEVGENTVSVRFDDGRTQKVVVSDLTPVRKFGSRSLELASALRVGNKLAVVGQVDNQGHILPQFILDAVPKSLSSGHSGKVTEVLPNDNVLKIRDDQGKVEEVIVRPETSVRSRDSDVSVEGIKPGSTVTVYGETEPSKQPTGVGPSPVSAPSSGGKVNATSVTVVTNGSGKGEKVEKKEPEKKGEKKETLPKESKKDR